MRLILVSALCAVFIMTNLPEADARRGFGGFMQAAFGPAHFELFATASFAVFGVQPGGVDADGAPPGMQDTAEVIGEAGHGDGGPPQVQRLLLLPTTTVVTALWFEEPSW